MPFHAFVLTVAALSAAGDPDYPHRARSTVPLVDLFSYRDYPEAALSRGAEGTAQVRLFIGADGALQECIVTESSSDPDLDRRTCEVIRERGRFTAARDARGRPVRDDIPLRITWRIEDVVRLSDGPSRTVNHMQASAAGGLTCTSQVTGEGVPAGTTEDCAASAQAAGMAEMLARLPPGSKLTYAIEVAAADIPAPAVDPALGQLLIETEARLTLAPDGRISECRVTRRDAYGDLFRGGGVADACAMYRAGDEPVFERAEREVEIRFIRINHRLYRRSAAPDD